MDVVSFYLHPAPVRVFCFTEGGFLRTFPGGTVRLRSNNPFDAPIINPGYLTHPFDVEAIREGARLAKQFFTGPAWDGYLINPVTLDPDTDPAAYDESTRNTLITTVHPTGTAAMSARNAKNGVLDPDLKVKGLRGLRVADSSAMVSASFSIPILTGL